MESISKIMNSTSTSIKVPSTVYKIKKSLTPKFKTEFYICCPTCKSYSSSDTSKGTCVSCFRAVKTSKSNYFVYIPLEQQIKESIEANFDDIISYQSIITSKKNVIADIHSCNQYKNAAMKYPNSIILPLVVNTDGASVFNSSTNSLWLIQLYQCYLPPIIRYIPENIIVVAAQHNTKICMKTFFYPLVKELRNINNKSGINIIRNGKTFNFMPLILNCCCDLPAKAKVQRFALYSGHFGCGYCLHPGVPVKSKKNNKSVIRYIHDKKYYPIRTHEDVMKIYHSLKSNPINGIQDVSCMIAANEFDLINGFGIDYMHCVLLGLMKKLLSLWLDSKNHSEQHYILKKNQIILSQRIVTIKPITEITRKPRSIFERKKYKANEFRSLLLYYLPLTLFGLLKKKYIDHFLLLSSSIYILLQQSISLEEYKIASSRIIDFVENYEILYGKENVVPNVHLLQHLPMAVKNQGPLWCQSVFGFETNNGVVVHSNTSKQNIVHQIAWKYTMRRTVNLKNYENVKNNIKIGGRTKIQTSPVEASALNQTINESIPRNGYITIFKNVTIRGKRFTSLRSKDISTVDYFVKLTNGKIGAIKYYIESDFVLYALIVIYGIVEKTNQFSYIENTQLHSLVNVRDISEKCLYFKLGLQEVVVCVPNNFEKT